MPDQPSQLPKQQFAASNSDTRQQTRMARLEDRVRQLEQGKQLVQVPFFRWDQPTQVTNTTSYSWQIDVGTPAGPLTGGAVATEIPYWFSIPITAVGGAASGVVSFIPPAGLTHSWTYSLAGAGSAVTAGPTTGAAVGDVSGVGLAKTAFIVMPFVLSSYVPTASFILTVAKTAGAGTGVSINQARFYAMVPSSYAS
jgi:hypothetical protein